MASDGSTTPRRWADIAAEMRAKANPGSPVEAVHAAIRDMLPGAYVQPGDRRVARAALRAAERWLAASGADGAASRFREFLNAE